MTKSDTALDMTLEELTASLEAIASPAEVATVSNFLALGLNPQVADDQDKARKRTAGYKLRTALRREPSSQHILQACAYVVFSRSERDALPFVQETLELPVSAGFDQKRTGRAMKRFVAGVGARKKSWIARTKSRLWVAILKAIKAQKTPMISPSDVTKCEEVTGVSYGPSSPVTPDYKVAIMAARCPPPARGAHENVSRSICLSEPQSTSSGGIPAAILRICLGVKHL